MAEVDIVIAIILGIFQGITEWLPISSSGQTILAMVDVLKIDGKTALTLAFYLHFGTLLAVLVKLRGDVKHIIVRLPRYKEDKLVQFIIISTIATACVGIPCYLLLYELFEEGIQGGIVTALVGIFLLLTGIFLYATKTRMGKRAIQDSNTSDSILAGISQGFAVVPGLSRSGVTLAALISKDFSQEEALHLSFLMSIPATIGIIIIESFQGTILSIGIPAIIAGVFAAFIVGYLAIDILLRFARNVKFDIFCIVFGMIAIAVAIIVML
jgi:undecaprenyl-diphosphatase